MKVFPDQWDRETKTLTGFQLKDIMKAKKKPIETVEAQPGERAFETSAITPPPPRPEGRIVGEGPEAVEELIRLLREESKVI